MQLFVIIGAISALLAVGLGAFGAHGLEGKIPDKFFDMWRKAVQYQMFHTTGLFIIALISGTIPHVRMIICAGWFMLAGIILFSGSLYVLSVTQIKKIGAITPFGGFAFLIAWVLVIITAVQFL